MISDGDNTVNGVSYQEALDEAVRDEVMIYSIIDVPVAASAGRDLAGEHAMITLAEQTGGAPIMRIRRRWTRSSIAFPTTCARNICWATIRTNPRRKSVGRFVPSR